MTRHRQRDEVRLDIGDVREEDEHVRTRTIRTRLRRRGELQGRDIIVENCKDETLQRQAQGGEGAGAVPKVHLRETRGGAVVPSGGEEVQYLRGQGPL